MAQVRSGLLAGLIAWTLASTASATANYVYHEQTTALTGGTCGNYLTTPAPGPTDSYPLQFKVEYQFYTDMTAVYYTTDGSTPSGAFGTASGTTTVLAGSYACTFTGSGGVVDVVSATIPAQPAGTVVRYIVSAWHTGGGSEVFANSGTCSGCGGCTTSSCATLFTYTVSTPDAGTDAGPPPEAGVDASVDAGLEAGVEGGVEAGVDGGFDAAIDVRPDVGSDAGVDVFVGEIATDVVLGDLGVADAGVADAGTESGPADAGTDVALVDTGTDSGTDAGVVDTGVPDSGVPVPDSSVAPDARSADGAVAPDATTDGGQQPSLQGGACNCAASGHARGRGWVLGVLVALVAVRHRRRIAR